MRPSDYGNKRQEYGQVKAVHNENGSVRIQVQVDRPGRNQKRMLNNVLVGKVAPGMFVVPQRGWWVVVDVYDDGMKVMTDVVSGPETTSKDAVEDFFLSSFLDGGNPYKQFGITDELEPGTLVQQIDRQTAIFARPGGGEDGDTYDLELHAGGDIHLRAGGEITYSSNVDMPTEEDGLTDEDPGTGTTLGGGSS